MNPPPACSKRMLSKGTARIFQYEESYGTTCLPLVFLRRGQPWIFGAFALSLGNVGGPDKIDRASHSHSVGACSCTSVHALPQAKTNGAVNGKRESTSGVMSHKRLHLNAKQPSAPHSRKLSRLIWKSGSPGLS